MTSAELLDVAMCRLRLPAPMAKLQVIHQVADALMDPSTSQLTWLALLRWLRSLRLESEIVEALAIVVLARGAVVLSVTELRTAIDAPSVLSDVLIGCAFETPLLVPSWLKGHSGEVPRFYQQPELGAELARGAILPRAFMSRMQELQRQWRKPFVAQWTYEFERLLDRNTSCNDGHFSYFQSQDDRSEVGQFVARRGHLARSAFLRALALAADVWQMPIEDIQLAARVATPADLSLLPMSPGNAPTWAEPLHGASPSTREEAERLVISLLRGGRDNKRDVLLHLNLPLHKDARFHGELEVASFFTSSGTVDADEAFHVHDFLPGRVFVAREDDLTLRVDQLDREAVFPAKAGGWLRPALLPVVDDSVGYLQTDLIARMPYLPSNGTGSPLFASPRKGGADLLFSGEKVGELWHWNWKWRPTHPKGMGGHTGVGVLLNHEAVEQLLRADEMRLVQVWRVRVLRRDDDYKDWIEDAWLGSVPPAW